MKKYYFIIFFIFLNSETNASIKKNIIHNLQNLDNISFNFEQNINGKIEIGNCSIKYPKKIFCKYKLQNQKILVSNGKSVVIKTNSSYYRYPIEKTPLNYILNKDFLIKKINDINERIIDEKFVNYKFFENENEINIFFDKNDFNLVGWQTIDIYQNLSITFLSSIKKNSSIKNSLFKLPQHN